MMMVVAPSVPGAAAPAPTMPTGAWSASQTPTATVVTGSGPLNVRGGPSTASGVVGTLGQGTRVRVVCQTYGQLITGPRRASAYWNYLGDARHVSDAYLVWRPSRPAVPWCANGGPSTARVAVGPVNLRAGAGTSHRATGRAADGSRLVVSCQRWGERVTGPAGTSYAWNLLSSGRYVADALVTWRPARPPLPWCGQAPPTVPATTEGAFVARVAPGARTGMVRYRVPASVTIAQAILESGWGRSGLTRRDHNYFGIKCFGEPGPIALGCRAYSTHECGGGRCWRTRASFRAYRDPAGSMADHGRFLVVNPRYRPAFRFSRDADRFAVAIHRAGYATSPTYARNLIRIMREHNLYRYDR